MAAGSNPRIFIGVSGGIAAYKACDLVSDLRKSGHAVTVVMTANATRFVQPITFETLSHNKVIIDLFDSEYASRGDHIQIKHDAALLAIVPATANIMAKAAAGIADDALSTIVLAATCPVLFAPAMNVDMWNHPTVGRNIGTLKSFGYHIVEPQEGELACGDVGMGKMADVTRIRQAIDNLLQ